ncbi:hypothetical protein BH20ACT5_BH20ACT5_22760 [soil metagenome]
MTLDPDLLEILACPDEHHSPLEYDEAAQELLCTGCDRAFPIRDGIPGLLLSAKAQTADIRAGIDGGADDYVTKPFEPLDLVEHVNRLLHDK